MRAPPAYPIGDGLDRCDIEEFRQAIGDEPILWWHDCPEWGERRRTQPHRSGLRRAGLVVAVEEITTLVATLVLPAILAAVPICYVVNVAKDRQRPLRSAVDTAQTLVTRWAVWLALLLVAVYGLLESIDRWSVRRSAGTPAWAVRGARRLGWQS